MKHTARKLLSLLLALTLSVGLSVPALAAQVPVTGLTLDKTSLTLTIGQTAALTATVQPENATDRTILWSSNKEAVATVSSSGVVTAVATGTAAVTAQSEDGQWPAICTVTVVDNAKDALTLSAQAVTTEAGLFQSKTLRAPAVTVKNGTVDVTDQYNIGYSWLDGKHQTMNGDQTAVITPLTQDTLTFTCVVAAVSKSDSTKTLTASCAYTVKVLPGTTLGADLALADGTQTFSTMQDMEGHFLLDQLVQGGESDLTPAIPGLSHVVFDLDSVTGGDVGTLNAVAGVSYPLTGDSLTLGGVTFTPAKTGTYEIEFTAYGTETYHGQLEIVVSDQMAPAEPDLTCDSSGFTFAGSDFFHSGDEDPVVSVVFGTPTAGKLLRNFIKGSGTPDQGAKYYTDSAADGDYHISTLSFLPTPGYSGLAELPVTFTSKSGLTWEDAIVVDVISKNTSAYFTDVTPSTVGTWAANAVDFAYGCGLVNGIDATHFGPDLAMTRAMLVTVLYRAAGSPQVAVTTNFTDLNVGDYYYNAVVWANVMGIVNGTSDTTFSPNAPVTRQQIAAILYRYADAMGAKPEAKGSLDGYTDKNKIDPYAVDAMTWAVGQGIISGMTGTTLEPQGNATRAQVVVILHRYLIGQ